MQVASAPGSYKEVESLAAKSVVMHEIQGEVPMQDPVRPPCGEQLQHVSFLPGAIIFRK